MKIGSVKFFKVLIVIFFILLFILPLVLSVVLGALFVGEKNRANRLEKAYTEVAAKAEAPMLPVGEPPTGNGEEPSFGYQQLYPHLYAQRPVSQKREPMTCYLTFDDGPSETTRKVLNILKEEEVKATFFVTGKASEENQEILRSMADAGHTIGVHTYSHDYGQIYASVEEYLADFDKMYRTIEEITGVTPTIFRFAGGSINVHNQRIYIEIIAEMTRRGFVFYDWNAAASDAVIGGITRKEVVNNILQSAATRDRVIVLMHDRADNISTASALPEVISGLRAQGYTFAPLTNEVEPITYFYPD